LTGRSSAKERTDVQADVELAGIRRVLVQHVALTEADGPEQSSPTSANLLDRAADAHRAYQAACYGAVISDLPELLLDADRLRTAAGEDLDSLLAYVAVYVASAKLLLKLGSTDLATLAADRAAVAAASTASAIAQGMAAFQVACVHLQADRANEAEAVAVAMAGRTGTSPQPHTSSLLSVAGALWLIAALAAARRADRDHAQSWLDHADHLAQELGADRNGAWTAFGPTNVAIHRVSVAAELGDPAAAVAAADTISVDQLPPGLQSRRAQVHLDLAWAEAKRKRDADATLHLLEAERIAPESIRYNVVVRETVWDLLARQRQRPSRVVADLAVRAGVLR